MEHTIQYVCKELGLTVHAVRFYCDKGLVPNLRHDAYGNRLFDEVALNWLRAVSFLRASGMSVAEIKEYFSLCRQGRATLPQRQQILIRLRQSAQKEMEAAAARVHCLDEKIAVCQNALNGLCEDDCNPMTW